MPGSPLGPCWLINGGAFYHRRARLSALGSGRRQLGFNVVTKLYERGSIIVTSNRGFADWGRYSTTWSSRLPSSTA